MKAAIYCRVSTDDQEKEGTSLKTQMQSCLDYCHEKGYEVSHRFSEAYSGLTLERLELIKLRNLIRANEIDVVAVYCLDRLSRNATHGVILRDEFDKHHVALESVTEDIDKTPLGEAITYLRGTFAQIEAEKIRERTMRGKLARLKEGKLPHGTGKGIYGYDWNKDTGRRSINDLESKVVQQIFTMALQGSSFHKIAVELNKAGIKSKTGSMWNPLTIRRMVANETYTGKTYSGKTRHIARTKVIIRPKEEWFLLPGVTPPIIDEETFKRTQKAILLAKQSRPIKPNAAFLLTGFIRCPKCGSTVGGTTLNGKYRYYQCRGARPTTTRGKICNAGYIKADKLENDVWDEVIQLLTSPNAVLEQLLLRTLINRSYNKTMYDKQISKLRKKLKTYAIKEKNFYELLKNEAVTKEFVIDAVTQLKKERFDDDKLLSNLLDERNKSGKDEDYVLTLSEFSQDLRNQALTNKSINDFETKRNHLKDFQLEVIAEPSSHKLSIKLKGVRVSNADMARIPLFTKAVLDFEKRHPDLKIQDIIDLKTKLPEDTYFGESLNKLKQDLVTIEQTSA